MRSCASSSPASSCAGPSTSFRIGVAAVRNQSPTGRPSTLHLLRQLALLSWVTFLLATQPLWMPFFLVGAIRQRRAIRAFIRERAGGRRLDDISVHALTMAWIEQNPRLYPKGWNDRKYERLKRRFKSVAEHINERGY